MFLINIQFGPQNALWLIEIEIAASHHTIPINALSSRLAEKEKPAINVKRIYWYASGQNALARMHSLQPN